MLVVSILSFVAMLTVEVVGYTLTRSFDIYIEINDIVCARAVLGHRAAPAQAHRDFADPADWAPPRVGPLPPVWWDRPVGKDR